MNSQKTCIQLCRSKSAAQNPVVTKVQTSFVDPETVFNPSLQGVQALT